MTRLYQFSVGRWSWLCIRLLVVPLYQSPLALPPNNKINVPPPPFESPLNINLLSANDGTLYPTITILDDVLEPSSQSVSQTRKTSTAWAGWCQIAGRVVRNTLSDYGMSNDALR